MRLLQKLLNLTHFFLFLFSLFLASFSVQVVLSDSTQAQLLQENKAVADQLLELGRQQDNIDALQLYQSALEIYRAINDRNGQGQALNSLGELYRKQGKLNKAIDLYKESLAIFKHLGDLTSESRSINNLGLVYFNLSQYDQALDFFQQALIVFKKINLSACTSDSQSKTCVAIRNSEVRLLNNLGLVFQELGQYDKAINFYQQSLLINKDIGNRKEESTSLFNLGVAYHYLREYAKAREFYQQSKVIEEEFGNDLLKARYLS